MTYVILIAGLIALVIGAEMLVRGAASIAARFNVSPLVIGLTVVAFGTSAPELSVSIVSSLSGSTSIALGNVVGSNIFNILLILGFSAVIVPLSVDSQLLRLDVPFMLFISCLTGLLCLDGILSPFEGTLMFTGVIAYTIFLIRMSRSEIMGQDDPVDLSIDVSKEGRSQVWNLFILLVGFGLLILGAEGVVTSATKIARNLGVSDMVIALTVVAGGTSLPEFVTSVVAAMKGERDMAIGNIVGSNIYNLLAVLGSAAAFSSGGIAISADVLSGDLLVMILVTFLCWPMFASHKSVSRLEGLTMLALFSLYMISVVGIAKELEWASQLETLVKYVFLPGACVIATVIAFRSRDVLIRNI